MQESGWLPARKRTETRTDKDRQRQTQGQGQARERTEERRGEERRDKGTEHGKTVALCPAVLPDVCAGLEKVRQAMRTK